MRLRYEIGGERDPRLARQASSDRTKRRFRGGEEEEEEEGKEGGGKLKRQ